MSATRTIASVGVFLALVAPSGGCSRAGQGGEPSGPPGAGALGPTDVVSTTIDVGTNPAEMVFAQGSLWVVHHSAGTVTRLDARRGHETTEIGVGDGPGGVAAGHYPAWPASASGFAGVSVSVPIT